MFDKKRVWCCMYLWRIIFIYKEISFNNEYFMSLYVYVISGKVLKNIYCYEKKWENKYI